MRLSEEGWAAVQDLVTAARDVVKSAGEGANSPDVRDLAEAVHWVEETVNLDED